MFKMSKQGNITSFFKPVSKQPKSTQPVIASRTEASSTPPPPSPSPPSVIVSSPPPVPTATVRDRNTVIRGSDDEDDDDLSSDDDFPELFTRPVRSSRPVQAPENERGVHATPHAKRRVIEFPSSPLATDTKHKFDMEALVKHAEADYALEKSEQRTAALLAEGSPTEHSVKGAAHASLHDAMVDVLSDPEGSQEEGVRGRLLRAVKRTEASAGQKGWYFFDRQGPADNSAEMEEARRAFPKAKATGVWAFLGQEERRPEVFQDGLPYNVQCRMQNLPDEIFQWVLDEALHETSKKLRDEYVRLISACPDQIERLLNDQAVTGLFQDLGASERALSTGVAPQSGSLEKGAPYPEHDRVRLETVLRILGTSAHAMKLGALTRTAAILLRLGIDNLVREDQAVAVEYQDALHRIVMAVPWQSWDNFVGYPSPNLTHLPSPSPSPRDRQTFL